jgi:hypothetical protein
MLDTSPSDADRHPLKLRDLLISDIDDALGWVKLVWANERQNAISDLPPGGLEGDFYLRPAFRSPEMASFTGTVMAIDPSGQGKDETAYAVVRALHGVLYVVEVGGFRDGYSEQVLASLAGIAARHRVHNIVVERNYGGGMFTQMLKGALGKLNPVTGKPMHNCAVEEVYHTGQKEARILDVLEPLFQGHKLIVSRSVIEKDVIVNAETPNYSLVYQITRLSRLKGALAHDDRVEALYMACSYFTDRLGRDSDVALKRHKDDAFNRELEEFMKAAVAVNGQRLPERNRKVASRRRW